MAMLDDGESFKAPAIDVTGLTLRIGVGLVFVGLGYVKLFPGPNSYWVTVFDEIGFGRWFQDLAGVMQAVGGLLFMVPRTTLAGAGVLGTTMVGAVLAHLFRLGTGIGGAIVPAAVLAVLMVIARRRPER